MTTSGLCARTAAAADEPSPTEATTSMSDCSPRRSSRASRNTWLSSTRTRRIGPAIGRRLFGREEQRIVGLSAHLDVDLHLGVALRDLLDEAVELGLLR